MSDRRTYRWGSGRLIRTALRDFWQAPKSLDAADPEIPNLPIVTPAAPPAGSAEGYPAQHRARSFRRDNQTNRHRIAVAYPHTLPAVAASTDASLVSPFETRYQRSRRSLAAGWMAGMAVQQQAAVIPYPSWAQPVQARRKVTERCLIEAPALHWNYIAPTIAAILVKPTAKVIEFRRTIQLPAPLALYPPPTGPPALSYPSWAARAVHRVSQDRRLQAQAAQASYPATPATPTAQGYPAYWLPVTNHASRSVRLLTALEAPVYPAPSAPPTVEFAALAPARSRRRKSSGMGFVSVPMAVEVPAPPTTTPAEHPAHVPQGYRFRRAIDRRLLVALEAPVFPAPVVTPTAQGYPAYLLLVANRVSRTVRLQAVPAVPAGLRRVEAFPAYLAPGSLRRKATQYTRALVADAPDTPQTPAVPEQPLAAFRLKLARYTPPQHRAHIAPLLVPEWPVTPPTTDAADTGGVWWVEFEHYRRRKERDRQELKRRREEAQRIADETAREIARLLHEQELKDAEAADLRRIRDLADRAQALRGSGQLSAVIERRLSLLAMETTRSALQALERELLEQIEQDEISALILILNDYETD